MNQKLVYSCSGCSSAAQMANWIAVQIDRKGVAEMSCIAGVGGSVKPLVLKARSADEIIGIDGCALNCVKACLAKENLGCTHHFDLSALGAAKKFHQDFDADHAKKILSEILTQIEQQSEARRLS